MPTPKKKQRYRLNLIKATQLYDTNEIAKLFGLHRNTVRHWFKDGLRPIDDRRPIYVHGSDLKAFLSRRQEARRQKCALGEIYCFRCRAPRTPWEALVDVAPHTEKVAKLRAICRVCETDMHRTVRRADVEKFVAAAERQVMASERLIGCPGPIENCDLKKAESNVETEPAE
jgi:DNA-binding transcriptional MerR regulator